MKIIFFIMLFIPLSAMAEEVSLDTLQKMTLAENKRIRAMAEEVEMMKKRIPRAGAPDDPKFKFGINNLPLDSLSLTKMDMTSKEIGLSQMFPLSGKLTIQEKIAVKEFMKARERLRKERAETLHMMRMNVYEIDYARNTAVILDEIRRQLKLFIDSEVAASKAGTGTLSNVIKANIEYAMIEEEIINLRQEEKEKVEQVYYILGDRVNLELSAIPEPVFNTIIKEEAEKTVLSDNPDIAMARLEMDIAGDEVALKKNESAPDMEVGVSYMQRDDGNGMKRTDMITMMATFNLPLWFWKKNIPMVDEMKKKYDAAGSFYSDKRNEVTGKFETLMGRIEKWRSLYLLYRDRIIPQIEVAYETSLARYRTGASEFMPLLDTVRMMLRYKKELYTAKKEYLAGYSELYSLMGGEVLP